MKELFYIVVMLFIGCSLWSQEKTNGKPLTGDLVPAAVLDAFTKDHPSEHGTWFREGEHYRVEFVQRSSRVAHTITYDADGKIVKRDSAAPESDEGKYREPRPDADRYLQPSDTGAKNQRPVTPSEALRVEDDGLPPAPANKAWAPERAEGKR